MRRGALAGAGGVLEIADGGVQRRVVRANLLQGGPRATPTRVLNDAHIRRGRVLFEVRQDGLEALNRGGQVVGIGTADVLGNDRVTAFHAGDCRRGDVAALDAQHAGKEHVDRVAVRRGQVHGDLDRIRGARPAAREHGKGVGYPVPCPQRDSGGRQRHRFGVGRIQQCTGLRVGYRRAPRRQPAGTGDGRRIGSGLGLGLDEAQVADVYGESHHGNQEDHHEGREDDDGPAPRISGSKSHGHNGWPFLLTDHYLIMATLPDRLCPWNHVEEPNQLTVAQGTLTVVVSAVPDAGPEARVGETASV